MAVLAFVIASPGGDDDGDNGVADDRHDATDTGTTETDTPTETGAASVEAEVTQIDIRGGEVVGGPAEVRVKNGDTVVIVVSADAPDDIHLHGYDIEKKVEPGQARHASGSRRTSRASSRSRATRPRTPAATRWSRPS